MAHPLLSRLSRHASEQGLLLALLVVCAYLSWATLSEQHTGGAAGGEALARDVLAKHGKDVKVLIVAGTGRDDTAFADALERDLAAGGATVVAKVAGHPYAARKAMEKVAKEDKPDVIAASRQAGRWTLLEDVGGKVPGLGTVEVMTPRGYRWPSFLQTGNLLNVANQMAVIAILAIGMTMVIITGGIDLSVGSLIALSAVTASLFIRDWGGAEQATPLAMVLCCLAAMALCGVVGLFSGTLITVFELPPFLVTLGMMLVASGLAFIVAQGQSIYQLPDSFVWLGRGADLFGVPNAVVLMLLLYLIAHVIMTRMTPGRYLLAVGGNAEAARLAGVPVKRVLLLAYISSAVLAGLGGVIMASQLKSGAPTYGQMYELYVIAAVVVGGTSLSGGEGRVSGTLVGAFLIAVIQNGMNLLGVESYTQKVVLGLVILSAVLLDSLKKRSWSLPGWLVRRPAPAPIAEETHR